MMKILMWLTVLLCLSMIASAAVSTSIPYSNWDYVNFYNLSNVSFLSALNLKVNNSFNLTGALDIKADGIAFEVSNSTGGRSLRINTTSAQTEFWDDAEGAGDYTKVYHDGTYGQVNTGGGDLGLGRAGDTTMYVGSSSVVPVTSNTISIGSTSLEWKGLYLSEDAGSGIYLGLDQDWHVYYNESTDDALWIEGATDMSIAATDLKIWDDAKATGDYLQILHDSSNAFIIPGSGYVSLRNSAGADRVVVNTNGVGIGGQTAPAMGLHVGTGSSSHSLTNINDTFVTGNFEVDGTMYVDYTSQFANSATFLDNVVSVWGSGSDSQLDWSTAQATSNTLVWGLGNAEGNSLVLTTVTNENKDFDHPAQSNPTIFVQSNMDPDTSNTEWLSISQATNDSTIDSGSNLIVLDDSTRVAGNISSQDSTLGTLAISLYDNGTHARMDTANTLQILNALEVWHATEAAGDYVSIYHDATNGWITTGSGYLGLTSTSGYLFVGATYTAPTAANTRDLGTSAYEWRGLYLSEDASSGAYFGLDQNWRLWYNETSADELYMTNSAGLIAQRWGVYNSFGSGATSRSLDSVNDTYVTGMFEVDDRSYFDGVALFQTTTQLVDNAQLVFGSGDDTALDWSTAQATENTLVWGLGTTANSLILVDFDYRNDDFDHPAQSNPTLFVHSVEDPDSNNDRWISVSHDNVTGVIDSGYGNITLDDTTNIGGDMVLGDNVVGTEVASMQDNGTSFVISTTMPVYFSNNVSVNSMITFTGQASVVACSASVEGSIYYNVTSHKHMGCNSTDWIDLY